MITIVAGHAAGLALTVMTALRALGNDRTRAH
jgi:hypothetical protein